MLTEKTEQKIEILPNGVIQVQDIRIILDNGNEITRSYSRKVLDVDADISNESPRIQRIANSEWTPQVKANRVSELNKIRKR